MKLLVTRKVIVSDMQIIVSDTYMSYHGCFDKGINNGDCQKYKTGSQIDMDYQR